MIVSAPKGEMCSVIPTTFGKLSNFNGPKCEAFAAKLEARQPPIPRNCSSHQWNILLGLRLPHSTCVPRASQGLGWDLRDRRSVVPARLTGVDHAC